MTDLSVIHKLQAYRAKHKVRLVTAAALFDGHDASINIMRRNLQASGAEVIHHEHKKHDGSLPIVGVNTFRDLNGDAAVQEIELARSSEQEKQSQLERPADFHANHRDTRHSGLSGCARA